jgi:AcrR family transcriptional regulator
MRPMTDTAPRRPGPGLSHATSGAIRAAVVDELAAVGYGRFTIDGVARRAKVGKAAVYRRWPSKQEMVMAIITELALTPEPPPDAGSLEDDVVAMLRPLWSSFLDPTVARIVPDLLAETARDPGFRTVVHEHVGSARRDRARLILRRAVDRGELHDGVDEELCLDLLAAPLYWRLAVTREPFDEDDFGRLVRVLLAGLRAA